MAFDLKNGEPGKVRWEGADVETFLRSLKSEMRGIFLFPDSLAWTTFLFLFSLFWNGRGDRHFLFLFSFLFFGQSLFLSKWDLAKKLSWKIL